MPYDAFISYSHSADLELAPQVRVGLQRLAKPMLRRRALSIFLDQASLELSSELGGSLDERIEDTRWLILFMSEQSAGSRWVGEEISEWTTKKSKDHLALVLTSGEVVWDNEAKDFDYERSTAVSEGMRGVYTGQDSEPLFLDLRWAKEFADGAKSLDLNHPRFRDAIATLAAPIHGIAKDELEGEDIRQHRRARRLRRAAISGLAALTIAAVIASIVAVKQRDTAIAERNRAEARRLATVATTNAAEQTDLALLLALESLNTTRTDEGWGALFTALSRPVLARSPLVAQHDAVNRLLFSPDGSVLASMHSDGTVGLWDSTHPADMQLIKRLPDHGDDVLEGAFSPDGSVLATPGSDAKVRLWDGRAGTQLGELVGHTGSVRDVAFSPDGKLLATASSDATVRLWDLEHRTQRDIETMGEPADRIQVWEVAFSADGSHLLWVSSDGSLRRRPVTTGSEAEVVLEGHAEWQGSIAPGVAFTHDRTMLAVASRDSSVQIWDLTSNATAELAPLAGHQSFVTDVAFSPDDLQLASASQDRTVRIWNVRTGQSVASPMTGHDAVVLGIAYSPDGKLLASGGADQGVRLWDLGAGGGVGRRLHHGSPALDIAVSPDGAILASAGMDGIIALWDAASGQRVHEIPDAHEGKWVKSLAFSPDATLLSSIGNDRTVRLWNVESWLPSAKPLVGHQDSIRLAQFSQDGKRLASVGNDGELRLWDTGSGDLIAAAPGGHQDVVWALAFNEDGSLLASASSDTTVRLRAAGLGGHVTEEEDAILGHESKVLDVKFLADGTHLLSVSSDGMVRRSNRLTREAIVVLDEKTEWTNAVFSADGSAMGSASADGTVRLWDLASGLQSGQALSGSTGVVALDFSRDGTLVVSASGDGALRLWPAQSRWQELACAAAGRNLSSQEWDDFVDPGRPYRRQCAQYGPPDTPGPAPET